MGNSSKLVSVFHGVIDKEEGIQLAASLLKQEEINIDDLIAEYNLTHYGASIHNLNDVVNSFIKDVAIACDDFKMIVRQGFEIAFCFSHIRATIYAFKIGKDVRN